MYKSLLRPILFRFDSESVHQLICRILRLPGVSKLLGWIYRYEDPSLETRAFGLTFKNPVGLAAGFDKNASMFEQLGDLGFGFIEIGTVTPLPQPGNARPRLFRLPEDRALINRMGFNNDGLEAVLNRLKRRRPGLIIGGNIGKNKVTPNETAISDYEKGFEALFAYVDYFVVNVSSPNTPNLRELQDREPLGRLLKHIEKLNRTKAVRKPILLKIAPDLTETQLNDIIELVEESGIDGIIATNTTISRDGLKTPSARVEEIAAGGLSGKPVFDRSTEVIRYIHQKSGGSFPIIGVGGIHSGADALAKIEAGATLVQIYSGFVYEGPALIREIKQTLRG